MTKTPPKKPRPTPSVQTSRRRSVRQTAITDRSQVAPSEANDAAASARITKLDVLIDLLRGPGGVSIAELVEATSWQPHSVRGAMSGALKRKGLTVTSEVTDGVRLYRIGSQE